MQGFLITIHALVSLFLVMVILMQASQGGGLSGTFGSGATSAIMGGRGAASLLSKLTTWLVIIFMTLALLITFFSSPSLAETESLLKKEAESRIITPGADLSLPTVLEKQ
ncbi:MAG TPA: preprotein translocase subunit SecG [Candidatus Marinimicrobia bacterium]|nr:preprotein translocase subunit SecG [Candidatus Neomarinimicrobiota bacterium]